MRNVPAVGNQAPPNSLEAETAVLGAMMLRKEYIEKAMELLSVDDFYSEKNRVVFKAITELYDRDIPTDIVMLSDHLLKAGKLDLVGGRGYLAKINMEVATGINVEKYALIVTENSLRRIAIQDCGVVINYMQDVGRSPFDTLGILKSTIDRLEEKVSISEIKNEAELIKQAANDIREQNSGLQKKLDFSIYDLNKYVSFRKKDMLIIGGRPSMGKTAFALTEAEYWASLGFKVLIVSIEMSALSLATRRMSIHSGFDFKTLDRGGYELDRAEEMTLKAVKGNLFIDDRADITVYNAKARVMQAVRKYGIEIVIWDYVQLMKGQGGDRIQELSELSRTLKRIGKDLNLWNVVLAQLNRDSTKSAKPELLEPKLSELQGTGSLEQDADIAIFTHRLAVYNPDYVFPTFKNENRVPAKNVGELLIRKQRNGKIGKVQCSYDGERMQWKDYKTLKEAQLEYEGAF